MTNNDIKSKTQPKEYHILWVDDQILPAFVNALRNHGFKVTTASSTQEALSLASKEDFDVYLVDIVMPPPDGIECLRQLHRIRPNARLATLSSYLYLSKYTNQLRALDFEVQLMDKDFPDPLDTRFEPEFIEPIRRLAIEGVTLSIKEHDKMVSEEKSGDPFNIPLVEFSRLPLAVKDQLRIKAGQKAAKTIRKAFDEGRIWVMLCGSAEVIRAQASAPDEIPTEDQIMEYAKRQQRPAYHFWRDINAEDMWSPCACGGVESYYPTVNLEFGPKKIKVHFDTGSPMTFFSYEELLSLAVIRPTQNFGPAKRAGYEASYWAAPLGITAVLRCQNSGQTREIKITGQIVRDWESSPYTKICGKKCKTYPQGNEAQRLCPERKALVGRNILIENALVLVLDGVKKQTRLEE